MVYSVKRIIPASKLIFNNDIFDCYVTSTCPVKIHYFHIIPKGPAGRITISCDTKYKPSDIGLCVHTSEAKVCSTYLQDIYSGNLKNAETKQDCPVTLESDMRNRTKFFFFYSPLPCFVFFL